MSETVGGEAGRGDHAASAAGLSTRPSRAPAPRAPAAHPPVIAIGGPTASGKSALALDLARALGGVVINADSMQVYRELSILTARPGPGDLAAAPHRLYGVLPAATRSSAAGWVDMALAEIALAQARGERPIVVGGTGLYLKALIEGLNMIPPVPEEVRRATVETLDAIGNEAFHEQLSRWDPVMARRLSPGDTQRMIRAWEVMVATGRSLADWQAEAASGPPPGMIFDLIVLAPPRDALYAACDGRFRRMVASGALDEVRDLVALGLDPGLPAMKAVGVPELAAHLAGDVDLETAIGLAQTATRQLAKRQTTWFRHQRPAPGPAVRISHVAEEQYSESLTQKILSFVRV